MYCPECLPIIMSVFNRCLCTRTDEFDTFVGGMEWMDADKVWEIKIYGMFRGVCL